ncbi:MAG TPA: pyruvoyl-dependent arginine decarboxylase [Candidatus Lokiarchaeia archaeon]|nr:pyruvoyl-dependent arginine decarboxylase [Candidatus Lokiarchaeia archaeon]
MLPTRFWVVKGTGIAEEHEINAYDMALYECGLADQNMLCVTSVPPHELIEVVIENGFTYVPMPKGMVLADVKKNLPFEPVSKKIKGVDYLQLSTSAIIHVVQSRILAQEGQTAYAAIGLQWYWTDKQKKRQSVYAVEDHGLHNEETCLRNCKEMLAEMLRLRGREAVMEEDEPKQKIVLTSITPPDNHVGVALVMVVMDPFAMHDMCFL